MRDPGENEGRPLLHKQSEREIMSSGGIGKFVKCTVYEGHGFSVIIVHFPKGQCISLESQDIMQSLGTGCGSLFTKVQPLKRSLQSAEVRSFWIM